jgi:hypothetical protein
VATAQASRGGTIAVGGHCVDPWAYSRPDEDSAGLISRSRKPASTRGFHRWARTVSNRRPLVCKSEPERPRRFTGCHSVPECPVQRLVLVHAVHGLSGCASPSWHTIGTTGVWSSGVRSRLRGGLAFSMPEPHDPPTCGGLEPLNPHTARAGRILDQARRSRFGGVGVVVEGAAVVAVVAWSKLSSVKLRHGRLPARQLSAPRSSSCAIVLQSRRDRALHRWPPRSQSRSARPPAH